MPIMFTKDELTQLQEMSKGQPELHEKLNNIESGTYYQTYMESVKEDVMMNIENSGYDDISDKQLEQILLKVSNYDYGDYNEFIDMTIENVMSEV